MKKYGLVLAVWGIGWSSWGTAHAQQAVKPQVEAKPQAPAKGEEPRQSTERKPRVAPDEHAGHDHAAPNPQATFSDYLWRASDEAFHAGDYEKAVKIHRSIQMVDPSDAESYSIAAWLTWSLGRKEEAVKIIDQGLKANPQNPEMWDDAGQHFTLQKLSEKSRDAFVKAMEFTTPQDLKTPDGMMLRRRLAHAEEKAGDLEGSATVWRALVTDFPDEAVNKNNLARVDGLIQSGKKVALNPRTGAIGGAVLAVAGLALFSTRLRNRHHDAV